MSADFEIRPLSAAEYKGFPVHAVYDSESYYEVELLDGGFRLAAKKREQPVRIEWTDLMFEDWLEAPVAYGAFVNGELAGIVEGSSEGWHALFRVSNLLVFDKFRRQGIARRLMEHIIAEAKAEKRYRGMILETQTCNFNAIALYRKLGFELCRIDTFEYTNNDVERNEVRIDLALRF